MADHVERVGLVFNADGSTDFVKTLKLVNSNLKESYENFKLTQTQWDKSTTVTQKLRDKLVFLNEAYDIQKDKVRLLNTELYEMESAENRDEVAISKKKAQLTQAEASLQRYKNQIDETNVKLKTHSEEIKKSGEKLENYGNKIEKAGNKLSAFSAATLAAFTAASKTAIDFESDFAGVEKTVDATDEQLQKLKDDIRKMAKEIPSSTKEISAVAEAAGQLGIATDDIMSFTRVMIDLGNSTNLSAEEAASSLAKFANVTKMNANEYSNLGSTIVALGNNFDTTEKDIVDMATRLAATGEITGLTQSQILALATAMSSVGIEAEAGGSAMSKLLKKIQVAVEVGGDDLTSFAKVAGVTADEFKEAFEKDAVKALSMFISGLNDTERNGKSAIGVLNDMDITEVRLSNTILSLANSSDLMTRAVDLANTSWEENNALSNEASKRYNTLKSKMSIAIDKLKDAEITIGNKLMPVIEKIIDKIEEWTNKFSGLNDEQVETIMKIGALVVALGPALKIIGSMMSGIGNLIKGFGNLKEALGLISLKAGGSGTALSELGTIIKGLVSPAGLAVAGLTALVGTTIYLSEKSKILSGDVKKLKDEVDSQTESWEKTKEVSEQYLEANSNEIANLGYLREELEKVVDENGNVKKGYEERAEYITNQLSTALGIEINLNNGIIENYQTIANEIDNIINKKKAEILLDAYKDQYATAIKNQAEAVETLVDLEGEREDLLTKLGEAKNKAYNGQEVMRLEGELTILNSKIADQMNLTSEYGWTIQNYEELTKASVSGNAEEIEKAIGKMETSWEKAKDSQKKSIDAQITSQEDYVENLKSLLNEAKQNNDAYSEYLIKNQLETAEEQLDNLRKQTGNMETIVEMSAEDMEKAWEGVSDRSNSAYDENLNIYELTRDQIRSAEKMINSDGSINMAWVLHSRNSRATIESIMNMSDIVENQTNNASRAISSDTKVIAAVQGRTNAVNSALTTGVDGYTWGQDLVDEMSSGIEARMWRITNAVSNVASRIKDFLGFSIPDKGPLSDFDKSMPDMIDLMVSGLRKSAPKLDEETKDIAENMKNNFEVSPSIRNGNLSGNMQYNGISEEILYKTIFRALTNCKIKFDPEGLIEFIDDRLMEVV